MAKVGNLEFELKVFEVTKELLIKYGVKGWNMDELSEACGVSKRTLYKIIGNKEDLLWKVIEDNLNKDIEARKKFLFSNESYPKILDSFGSYIAGNFEEFILLNASNMVREFPKIGDLIENKKKDINVLFQEFLNKGQQQGFIVDSINTTDVVEFIEGCITYNIHNCNSPHEFYKRITNQLNIIIRGVRKINL